MSDWLEFGKAAIPVLGTLGGIVIGSYFTRRLELDKLKLELKAEKDKEKLKNKKELISIYNNLLKLNGEIQIVSLGYNGFFTMDFQKYNEVIRPLLFEHFHLLDKEIVELVKRIDENKMEIALNIPNIDNLSMNAECAKYYEDMINRINKLLDNYRLFLN